MYIEKWYRYSSFMVEVFLTYLSWDVSWWKQLQYFLRSIIRMYVWCVIFSFDFQRMWHLISTCMCLSIECQFFLFTSSFQSQMSFRSSFQFLYVKVYVDVIYCVIYLIRGRYIRAQTKSTFREVLERWDSAIVTEWYSQLVI